MKFILIIVILLFGNYTKNASPNTFPFENLDFLSNCISVDGKEIEPTERFVVMYSIEPCKPCKSYEKELAKKIANGVIPRNSYITISTFYTDIERYKQRYFRDSLDFQLAFLKDFDHYSCDCSFPTFAGYENGKLVWQSGNKL